MLNIAVFVSGRGSNLGAILNSIRERKIDACVKTVISGKIDCPAIKLAEENNIEHFFVSESAQTGFETYESLLFKLKLLEIQLIVLAGFIKKIPQVFTEHFKNKIINIHPALLPSFGGKGMYGSNVHQAVFTSSAQVSGASVHFVNNKYDEGRIIAQRTVDISDVKSPDEIAARVLKIEHELLPAVIQKFSEKKVKISGSRVIVEK